MILTIDNLLSAEQLARLKEDVLLQIAKHPAAFPEIIATSSEKGLGLDELRKAIVKACHS